MATTRTAKTTAAQRAAKKATPSNTKAPAKKTTARKPTAAKKTAAPLAKRQRDWMTDAQCFAVLAARMAGINTDRIQDWVDHQDGTVTRALDDGTLYYKVATRTLRWQATCRMGAVHTYRIDDPSMATVARVRAATCTLLHADLTGIPALTEAERAELGIATTEAATLVGPVSGVPEFIETQVVVPVPEQQRRALGDTLTHSDTSADETQPLSRDEIAAGLAARADNDQPQEHPEP